MRQKHRHAYILILGQVSPFLTSAISALFLVRQEVDGANRQPEAGERRMDEEARHEVSGTEEDG